FHRRAGDASVVPGWSDDGGALTALALAVGRGVDSAALRRHIQRRRLGCQVVEAGERLVLAIRREPLEVSQEPVGSEDPERQGRWRVGAAAGADRTEGRLSYEHRLGSQAEDVVETQGVVVGEIHQGA